VKFKLLSAYKSEPLVSIIINCYNGGKYLKQAIDSVFSQTYKNWEIIFWDNHSQDNSAEIINSYKDKRIKYFYSPRHTILGEARNIAIKKASGEWLAILDCDDIWYKNKLYAQLREIKDDVGMIYSRVKLRYEGSGYDLLKTKSVNNRIYPKFKRLPSGDIFSELLYECFIPCPSVLIRKDLFFKVGAINKSLRVAEDYDIFLKIARISKVIALDRVLCIYRIHDNNLSNDNYESTFQESLALVLSYSLEKNIAHNIIYWKLKYLKYLIRRGYYKKFLFFAFKLNMLSILQMIKHKHLTIRNKV
jgi:glycosyltransferase involved in cell wall biosynthesis